MIKNKTTSDSGQLTEAKDKEKQDSHNITQYQCNDKSELEPAVTEAAHAKRRTQWKRRMKKKQ